jgi:hypothetical protein
LHNLSNRDDDDDDKAKLMWLWTYHFGSFCCETRQWNRKREKNTEFHGMYYTHACHFDCDVACKKLRRLLSFGRIYCVNFTIKENGKLVWWITELFLCWTARSTCWERQFGMYPSVSRDQCKKSTWLSAFRVRLAPHRVNFTRDQHKNCTLGFPRAFC